MRILEATFVALTAIHIYAGLASAQPEKKKEFLWKQCNEYALGLRLDPGPIQGIVGSEFSLALEEGKATVAILVQNCLQYWLNGENLGPTQHAHVWVSIDGPQDIRPVVGAQQNMPTRTWFNLFAGSTNPHDREAREASGTSPEPIERVHLDPPSSPLGGQVRLGPGLNYSWTVSPSAEPPRPIGFNHDVYLRDGAGNTVLKRIQGIGNMVGEPAQGTLKVVGGADPRRLVGAGTYPVRVFTFFPVWARLTLNDELLE